MKIIKSYVLSEKTLEKDIDKFIRDSKKGVYQYDYKCGIDGLVSILNFLFLYNLILYEMFPTNNQLNGFTRLNFRPSC